MPFMALFYIALALGVVILNIGRVPAVFHDIVYGAFNPSAGDRWCDRKLFLSMKKGVPEVFSPMKPDLVQALSLMPVRIQANL